MTLVRMSLLAAACTGTPALDDTAAEGLTPCDDLPGLQDWQPQTTDPPRSGDTVQGEELLGLCGEGSDRVGHHTVLATTPSGDVLCAVTWRFGSDGDRTDCPDCDLAFSPRWELPIDYGSAFCEDTFGYDPASIDLSFWVGLGIGPDDQMWMKEENYDWEPIDGLAQRTDYDDGSILVRYIGAFTL